MGQNGSAAKGVFYTMKDAVQVKYHIIMKKDIRKKNMVANVSDSGSKGKTKTHFARDSDCRKYLYFSFLKNGRGNTIPIFV